MSDPVSNHDIEDVLSSIRRLVAQGNPKGMQKPANAPTILHPQPPVTASKQDEIAPGSYADRLVLTPAFRVPDDDQTEVATRDDPDAGSFKSIDAAVKTPESDTIPTKDPRPMPPTAQSPSERESLEATIAELEAAVSSRADEWEPDGSEIVSATVFSSVFRSKIEAARLSLREVETETPSEGSEDAVTSAVADHIADTVAEELQEAFPHLQAADEPHHLDTAEDDDAQVASNFEDVAEPEMAQEPETATTEQEAAEADIIDVEDIEIEDIEIEDPRIVSPAFRHASFQEVYDPVAEATADAAEAAPDAGDLYGDELAPDPEEAVMGSAVANPAGTQLMDPDMMRAMVSQMIREELQGEMGERITRNVRKLVRREINRVISAQEFE